ncbi:MAG: ANTAR domain-containing protein [Rhodobiaceae bacterium]|nr:ANTAR domain-containing protein [Rhodobiaceae bacterium]
MNRRNLKGTASVSASPVVVVIDENDVRAAILEDGLREAGFVGVTRLSDTTNLMRQLVSLDPDVIIIDLENPSRDVLEQMFQVSRSVSRPVAMFVDQSDSEMTNAAMDAGVSAYVVDGLKKERVKTIVDTAISRFNTFSKLRAELEEARTELADRKVIERAKGIMMHARKISEDEAYTLLRRTAMTQKKRLADIAQSVITASDLLGGTDI